MWTTSGSQHCVIDFTANWKRTAETEVDYGCIGTWRPLDLLLAVRNRDDFARRDRIAFELVQLAKHGHAAADQMLLMAMMPRVVHLTRTCRGLRALPIRDAQAIALGAMWEAIRVHPDRQTTAVLNRLGMDALGIVTRTHSSLASAPEYATDPETMSQLRENDQRDVPSIEDLATLLRWGLETAAITRNDVRVIAAVDLGERSDRDALATELGIAPSSLVRRAHRIRARLKSAVFEEIAQFGTW